MLCSIVDLVVYTLYVILLDCYVFLFNLDLCILLCLTIQ